MKRPFLAMLAALLTAATAWFMVHHVRPAVIASTFAAADWRLAMLAVLGYGLVQWLRAWRFSLMTTGAAALPGARFITIAFRLNFLNFVIPFRMGELGYPVMMHREYGQPPAEAVAILLLARIHDLAVVGSLILGLAAWHGVFGSGTGAWAAGIAAGSALLMPALLVSGLGGALGRISLSARLERYRLELAQAVRMANRGSMLMLVMGMTLASWLTYGLASILAASAVTQAVPALAAMFGAAAGNLAFALPVNGIAGLGSSQAAWVLAVTWAGCSLDAAVITALSAYLLTLANALLGGGMAFLATFFLPLRPARLSS